MEVDLGLDPHVGGLLLPSRREMRVAASGEEGGDGFGGSQALRQEH